jgi:hypothetical protein
MAILEASAARELFIGIPIERRTAALKSKRAKHRIFFILTSWGAHPQTACFASPRIFKALANGHDSISSGFITSNS